jgi:hypothetical protein
MDGSDLAAKVQQADPNRPLKWFQPVRQMGLSLAGRLVMFLPLPKIVNRMPVFKGGFRS